MQDFFMCVNALVVINLAMVTLQLEKKILTLKNGMRENRLKQSSIKE